MGGGPSQSQKDAAARQAELSKQEAQIAGQRNARENEQWNTIKPYAYDRLNNGLPFYDQLTDAASGTTAKAFAPTRAALQRQLSLYGDLPSGYKDQMLADLDTQQARAFDDQLVNNMLLNENAKSEAARLITGQQQIANPLGFYGAAGQSNQSIMQAPLQSAGIGGLLGGIAGGAASAIPF